MCAAASAATKLAWVMDQVPSAATRAVLESLVDVALPRELRVLASKAWEREHATVGAIAAAARVAATVCHGGPDAQDDADAELALALRRTDGEMAYQLHQDRALVQLPVLYGVFRAGECTLRHVNAFLDITADVKAEDRVAIDAEISARAASMTVSAFRRIVRKTMAKLDTRTAEEKTKARRPRIGVRCLPQPDGLITIAATMPAADGIAVATELNRRADAARTPDDERTHGERQIDVLRDALHGASATDSTHPSRRTEIQVVIDYRSLLGLRDNPAELLGAMFGRSSTEQPAPSTDVVPTSSVRPSRRVELQVVIDWRSLLGLREDPAELIGYGSIAATDARAMLAQPGTVLRRLVTDPETGVLLDYGTSRYRPDAHLSGLTKARDVTCRYPGCTRNAVYCDDEHCEAFPHGPTSAGNVCQLCRTHHRRKTTGRFSYSRPDPATGETVWTTPLGFTYAQDPASYDEAGPDPGNTWWIDDTNQEHRWIPTPKPATRNDTPRPPPPAPRPPADDDPPPF
jgi:hypothetical protein